MGFTIASYAATQIPSFNKERTTLESMSPEKRSAWTSVTLSEIDTTMIEGFNYTTAQNFLNVLEKLGHIPQLNTIKTGLSNSLKKGGEDGFCIIGSECLTTLQGIGEAMQSPILKELTQDEISNFYYCCGVLHALLYNNMDGVIQFD